MSSLPDPENFEEITRKVTKWCCEEYRQSPHTLNWGWCYYWALLVWSLTSEKLDVKFRNIGITGHVVIEFNGKFFDSQHTEGTDSEDEFGSFGEMSRHAKDAANMCNFWLRHGKYPGGFADVINELYNCDNPVEVL